MQEIFKLNRKRDRVQHDVYVTLGNMFTARSEIAVFIPLTVVTLLINKLLSQRSSGTIVSIAERVCSTKKLT